MDRWAVALLLSAALAIGTFMLGNPFGPVAGAIAVAVFMAVFFALTFVLLRMSFVTSRAGQWMAAAVLVVAWIMLVSYGMDVVRQLSTPVHDDRCVPSDPDDPDCGSPGWGM